MRENQSWGEILKLSIPTVFMYLGIIFMQVVDLAYLGKISPAATAAFGFSNSIYTWFLVAGIGLFSALDFIISYNRGSGNFEKGELALGNAVWLCLILGLPITAALFFLENLATWMKLESEIIAAVHDFHFWLALSWLPTLLGCIGRSYLQAFGRVRLLALTMVLANLLNWGLNELLVLGGGGLIEPLGVKGAGIATFWSRIFMAGAFLWGATFMTDAAVSKEFKTWKSRMRWHPEYVREIVKVGVPPAFQYAFEVGAFALSGTLSTLLGSLYAASHQIVINMASFAFMVPMGLGTAAATMIGKRYGERNLPAAKQVGNRGLALTVSFMSLSCFSFLLFPEFFLRIYTRDPQVIEICRSLLVWVGIFQLADGVQGFLGGALRGLADTKFSMWANLICHWLLGLPTGILLCFWIFAAGPADRQLAGLWMGLALGLFSIAMCLWVRWQRVFSLMLSNAKPDERHVD